MTIDITRSIDLARTKYMQQRRVVCTGNPHRPGTLAQGLQKIYPQAVFLCRGHGWDLTDHGPENHAKLSAVFSQSNTFFNCSYISAGTQSWLLAVCHGAVKFCDVINIGSTHEYDGMGTDSLRESKLHLRAQSLALDSYRFRTTHCVLGTLDPAQDHCLDIDTVCAAMVALWDQPFHVPLTSMTPPRQPW